MGDIMGFKLLYSTCHISLISLDSYKGKYRLGRSTALSCLLCDSIVKQERTGVVVVTGEPTETTVKAQLTTPAPMVA